MSNKMKRNLTGPPGRAALYLVAGILLFSFVVQGAMQAVAFAYEGLPGEPRVVKLEKPAPAKPERHVPPAEVTYPIF